MPDTSFAVRAGRQLAPTLIAAVILIGYVFTDPGPGGLALGVNIAVAAIASVGLTLAIGGAGQFSLGQAGFMAIGGYGTAYLMLAHEVQFLWALLAAVLLALVVGALVGYIALRLHGNYLAMATLAVSSGIYALLVLPGELGGANGYAPIPFPVIFGHKFIDPVDQYLLVAVTLILVLLVSDWLLTSRGGKSSPRSATTRWPPAPSASTSPPARCRSSPSRRPSARWPAASTARSRRPSTRRSTRRRCPSRCSSW